MGASLSRKKAKIIQAPQSNNNPVIPADEGQAVSPMGGTHNHLMLPTPEGQKKGGGGDPNLTLGAGGGNPTSLLSSRVSEGKSVGKLS